MNTVIIGVGSNINPMDNIEFAREKMSQYIHIVRSSTFVRTKPIGYTEQNEFYNGAFLVRTERNYNELRNILKNIEKELGRVRTGHKHGPRTIDLDILVWNEKITDNDVYDRDFLQKAIKELLPDFVI